MLFIIFLMAADLKGQEPTMDVETRHLLDSLNNRISILEGELPRLSESKSPSWFFKKRELDYTRFLKHYTRYLFEEELEQAHQLVNSRLEGAKKRGDPHAVEFYKEYQKCIAREIVNHQRHYQELFKKERNFRKEIMKYLDRGDEYSIRRAIRMSELAIKYAEEKNLTRVQEYLYKYRYMALASLTDLGAGYDLVKLTSSEKGFYKVFNPLLESDSMELIMEAGNLVDQCLQYSRYSLPALDTSFFALQKNAVLTTLSDFHTREGNKVNLNIAEGQSVIARLDSLNRDGVYKWHDYILVVGSFNPSAGIENVKKGEAIIDADHKLTEYIRVNQLAKLKKVITMGSTFVVPFQTDDPSSIFIYNPQAKKYQYMVCYTRIENQKYTDQISKLLPPLQFEGFSVVN